MQLESQVNSVKDVTGRLGSNKEWTNPSLRLWALNDSITDVHEAILLRLNTVSSMLSSIFIFYYYVIIIFIIFTEC